LLSLFKALRVAPPMRLLILLAACALAACGPRNQDKLDDNELATAAGSKSEIAPSDTRCAAQSSQEEVKRQLFARAAEIRGSNAENYARIASFALIEVEGAAPETPAASTQIVECRGRATLRLPAGLKVAGGRTALTGDIGYSIAPGTRGTVTLGQSDPITIPLATLTQVRAKPAPAPVPTATPDPLAPAVEPPEPAASPAAARPSFNCGSARTQGEQAVCASPALAALDRVMAAQYRAAVARADPQQAMLLRETRDRFLGYRDRCPSDNCIANTYNGRIREIDDIMANRWKGRIYRGN
jgi:hypothetical protein